MAHPQMRHIMIQRSSALTLPAILLTALSACSSTPTYNATVFPYEINTELVEQTQVKRVIIANINLGGPSRRYLRDLEPQMDKKVELYLEENGIEVLPQRLFEQHWKTAVRAYGNPVDPTSGKVNQKTFTLTLIAVRDQLRKSDNIDAIVFTELLEQEVSFSGGLKHLARWHGVTRKPTMQGPGDGVSADFNWNKPAKAASLRVSIYNMDLQRLFISVGGLDTTEAIDSRSSSGRFVQRRSLLENDSHVHEGIQLAFYPFLPMNDYPGLQYAP
jgi:hypothetical protein